MGGSAVAMPLHPTAGASWGELYQWSIVLTHRSTGGARHALRAGHDGRLAERVSPRAKKNKIGAPSTDRRVKTLAHQYNTTGAMAGEKFNTGESDP